MIFQASDPHPHHGQHYHNGPATNMMLTDLHQMHQMAAASAAAAAASTGMCLQTDCQQSVPGGGWSFLSGAADCLEFSGSNVICEQFIFQNNCSNLHSTVNDCRMSHRKWREHKQQLIRLPDLALPGCILVSFHILCDMLLTFTVWLKGKT